MNNMLTKTRNRIEPFIWKYSEGVQNSTCAWERGGDLESGSGQVSDSDLYSELLAPPRRYYVGSLPMQRAVGPAAEWYFSRASDALPDGGPVTVLCYMSLSAGIDDSLPDFLSEDPEESSSASTPGVPADAAHADDEDGERLPATMEAAIRELVAIAAVDDADEGDWSGIDQGLEEFAAEYPERSPLIGERALALAERDPFAARAVLLGLARLDEPSTARARLTVLSSALFSSSRLVRDAAITAISLLATEGAPAILGIARRRESDPLLRRRLDKLQELL